MTVVTIIKETELNNLVCNVYKLVKAKNKIKTNFGLKKGVIPFSVFVFLFVLILQFFLLKKAKGRVHKKCKLFPLGQLQSLQLN